MVNMSDTGKQNCILSSEPNQPFVYNDISLLINCNLDYKLFIDRYFFLYHYMIYYRSSKKLVAK